VVIVVVYVVCGKMHQEATSTSSSLFAKAKATTKRDQNETQSTPLTYRPISACALSLALSTSAVCNDLPIASC
jgi:hypothetical protein